MGLSWSNSRRRTTTFYHPHPPPPPPLPPYYYHPGEAAFSSSPATASKLLHNHTTINQQSPHHHHNLTLYPTHPPPPVHSYYNSHPYHSRNYANHNYQYQPFYYTSHYQPTSGWSPVIRPNVGFTSALPIQLDPAPFVDHQNAKRIRNDVNVHKDTLKVEIDVSNPDHFLVSFVFDALFHGRLVFDLLVLKSCFCFDKEEVFIKSAACYMILD
ncbi:hypothetical protein OIU84_018446 [Salix udensis]|uniref:RING-type E3 ubiquitin transferase n=1 Tax=Salix udensis TaxID=889485 RepID=A0AAD6KYC6_9ROSI|nr:hypothetical protein OIU84_018446 [Salix udensis]